MSKKKFVAKGGDHKFGSTTNETNKVHLNKYEHSSCTECRI
jgi:hypothetical protein